MLLVGDGAAAIAALLRLRPHSARRGQWNKLRGHRNFVLEAAVSGRVMRMFRTPVPIKTGARRRRGAPAARPRGAQAENLGGTRHFSIEGESCSSRVRGSFRRPLGRASVRRGIATAWAAMASASSTREWPRVVTGKQSEPAGPQRDKGCTRDDGQVTARLQTALRGRSRSHRSCAKDDRRPTDMTAITSCSRRPLPADSPATSTVQA